MTTDILWQTKLHARLHDPAEKALVLLRDPAGHEGGSIVGVGRALGFETHSMSRPDGSRVEKLKLPREMEAIVKRADHWASAADRAQFPREAGQRYPDWAQVRFGEAGEIVHPLSGSRYEVPKIGQDALAAHIRTASEFLFKELIVTGADGPPDLRLSALAFWRFGPELGRELAGIGHLWRLLPADTRTPDHTIWQHLDLTSAFAGAMAGGGRPALLTVSIGPVQDFIAAGRSTSDLWAGSHFLSTLAWQAMKVVAERLGPDAILFPQLRGVPVVDLWLRDQGVPHEHFKTCEWNDQATDYNPLFGAALPNKFVALVPEAEGAGLAAAIAAEVRAWVLETARAMLDRALEEIGEKPAGQPAYRQLEQQLSGFPEVHWSLVPWLAQDALHAALAPFYGDAGEPGLFATAGWKTLTAPIDPEQGWRFFEPNDGTLYPALHDLGERVLSAAKAARPFAQLEQRGYRDSLSGEYEWLTLDPEQLTEGSPRRREDTLWARLAKERPGWVKPGEVLSAFGLIKRLWPSHFIGWLRKQGIAADVGRYTVSTHVMALAPSLERLLEQGPQDAAAFRELQQRTAGLDRAALPRKLMTRELRRQGEVWDVAGRLPTLIDQVRERSRDGEEEAEAGKLVGLIEKALGLPAERYYGLILMDGDKLGGWLAGDQTLEFGASFHSRVGNHLENHPDDRLRAYLNTPRPSSPARHMAISEALNGFSLDLVRHVVEDLALGKLLYAGGDDVMAMTTARDLLETLSLLRAVYSGSRPGRGLERSDLDIGKGFVRWRDRLYLAMGERATASAGAVLAHHQAPLGLVLREVRAAERRAKGEGGRDAFSLSVVKRSGGTLRVTAKWGEPMDLLRDCRDVLEQPSVSRRAVYHSLLWLRDLPDDVDAPMLGSLLAYQLARQTSDPEARQRLPELAARLAALAVAERERREYAAGRSGRPRARTPAVADWLTHFLGVAEFLAREDRSRTAANPAGASAGQGAP
jgi:CRISPR-associated protein Cmr2